jgi:hypothetical protein
MVASRSNFSKNGSGICIADLFSSSKVLDAKEAPWIPSLPVDPPARIMKSLILALLVIIRSFFPIPIDATSTRQ